ncbi:hypothetical protein T552_01411 [Pneumocystis carinii B80]|uniref:Replication protein A subunit n=1 Tax=Pneumocystis carinii (strain B80) TaxID=1408658 RepID=A0A0W4ZK80_PNEC8|nr:hypothetical protein T552_01411 [Pneumocystis carinii B80]KTW28781.1 hypothetical protein T552_01411 [Pneumocystis carinii B80]
MTEPISIGSLKPILNAQPGALQTPIFQVLQVRKLTSVSNGVERYRIVLSDSIHYVQSMLASQKNELVVSGKLQKGAIVQLIQFSVNMMKERKIIIIINLNILEQYGILPKIGAPASLEPSSSTADKEESRKQEIPVINQTSFYGNKPLGPTFHEEKEKMNHISSVSSTTIYPIESLSPYQNKWTIKARVTNKTEIKHWHNQKGEGKLFSCIFMDESGEIRATAFNDQVDMLYDALQEGQVYFVSKCRVNIAKKQFSNVQNEYELTFERDTEVERCPDQSAVPHVKFNFVSLKDLDSVGKDSIIDVIGILNDIHEIVEITSKTTQKLYSKRDIFLVDNSNYSVRLTLWGKHAQDFNIPQETIVAFKGLKVTDFNGRSLSMLSGAMIIANPQIEEAYLLKKWYDKQGKEETFMTHQPTITTIRKEERKTIAQIKDEQLGMTEQPDYFSVKATIVFFKQENIFYPACPIEGCNKKAIEDNEGRWRCERCDKSFLKPQYRYIVTISVNDHTGQIWLNCFDDIGRQIIGKSADDIAQMKEENEQAALNIFHEANCKSYVFRVRAKQDSYNGAIRVRYQVMGVSPINWAHECKLLADIINSY